MKTTINNAAEAHEVSNANMHKSATFTSVDLWSIHKLVRSRVYRKYL